MYGQKFLKFGTEHIVYLLISIYYGSVQLKIDVKCFARKYKTMHKLLHCLEMSIILYTVIKSNLKRFKKLLPEYLNKWLLFLSIKSRVCLCYIENRLRCPSRRESTDVHTGDLDHLVTAL